MWFCKTQKIHLWARETVTGIKTLDLPVGSLDMIPRTTYGLLDLARSDFENTTRNNLFLSLENKKKQTEVKFIPIC